MALSPRSEQELKTTAQSKLKVATDPIEKLRLRCLARGANGIRGLERTFRIFDNDGNRQLDYQEFQHGLNDYGLLLKKEEIQQLYQLFDKNHSGLIDFDEFLELLRPPMSERRKRLIEKAFIKMDRTGDGKITVDDLKGVYSVRHHKKYLNGEWTEDQCLKEFLISFDTRSNTDGIITKDEFFNYYAGVSASIDQDPYFDLMMRNAYGLKD